MELSCRQSAPRLNSSGRATGDAVGGSAHKSHTQSTGYIRSRVSNGGSAAAGIEQSHRLCGIRGNDQRTGISPGAEGAGVDHNLIGVRDDKLLSHTTPRLVLNVNVGIHGTDGGTGKTRSAPCLGYSSA